MGCQLSIGAAGRPAGTTTDADQPVLVVRSLSKSFPGQVALGAAELTVHSGEVHALLGQNGSGKSTLIKILAGFYKPDPGADVNLGGRRVDLAALSDTDTDRIRVMHQDLGLVSTLNIMENLALGRGFHSTRLGGINWRQERRSTRELLGRFGLDVDPRRSVGSLSAAEQAIVGLARAIENWDAQDGLLVLDEPTASLSRPEVLRLFDAVRRVAALGAGILFVTHRLDEVFDIAGRVTVLRDGRTIGSRRIDGLDEATLVEMIVGGPIGGFYADPPEVRANTVFEAGGVWGAAVEDFNLAVRAGEIVGVAGIVGSGRDEIAGLLSGTRGRAAGWINLESQRLPKDIRSASALGISYIPADRKIMGSIQSQSVAGNILLGSQGPLFSKAWLSSRAETAEAAKWISQVDLRPADPSRVLSTLSGGNQQKAVVARVLRRRPRVIVLDEPTQGVDVGAKATIYELLAGAAQDGAAVIISSSDNEELSNICDRVLVMRRGRIDSELSGSRLTTETITELSLR